MSLNYQRLGKKSIYFWEGGNRPFKIITAKQRNGYVIVTSAANTLKLPGQLSLCVPCILVRADGIQIREKMSLRLCSSKKFVKNFWSLSGSD